MLKRFRWPILTSLFCLLVTVTTYQGSGSTPAGQGSIIVNPLNDRAAEITGVDPLKAADIAVSSGLSGAGQIVGIADSGLDAGSLSDIHPDLASTSGQMPKVVMLKSWAGRAVADDPDGHGTHMAATIAGTGHASGGRFQGIAPKASLYFQALLDKDGNMAAPANLDGLFFPAYAAGVRVHVDGWGGGVNQYGQESAQIDSFIRRHPDFLAVFGAGNSGPGTGSLTTEANSKNALVVGASGNPRPALDPLSVEACKAVLFSSRGPTGDGRIKPDLLAPGQSLVSARSREADGNFPGNSSYMVMGGTSMAAAVTGGSLALLREYLSTGEDAAKPSAALLKALLINGVRVTSDLPGKGGFGILDLTSTVLGLKEKNTCYIDEPVGLNTGETRSKQLEIKGSTPFKATLVWTDAPGSAGKPSCLVNDLDLIVTGPDGETYYGNHFLKSGNPDRVNNVEQVFIANPTPGVYTITVRSFRCNAPQDYALVWGSVPHTGTIASRSGKSVVLEDGRELKLPENRLLVLDGKVHSIGSQGVPVGADLCLFPQAAYFFAHTAKIEAAQAVPGKYGILLMEADAGRQEGGYIVADPAQAQLNEKPVADLSLLPVGGELTAIRSPFTQRLWQVKISLNETKGFLARVDSQNNRIWLLGRDEPYYLSDNVTLGVVDRLVDCSKADAPFAQEQEISLSTMVPGLAVRVITGEPGDLVGFLAMERELAVGRITGIDPASGSIKLETGKSYQLFPNAVVTRDAQPAIMSELQTGDHVTATLLPNSDKIINLQVYSQVCFGKVLYASDSTRTLSVVDEQNHFRLLSLTDAKLYRWGKPVDLTALASGNWVRLLIDVSGKNIVKAYVAEAVEERSAKLVSYDSKKGCLNLGSGESLGLSSSALITNQGYCLSPEDLVSGQILQIAVLSAPPPWGRVAVAVQVEGSDENPPSLAVQASPREGETVLSGRTTADRLYLYRAKEPRRRIAVSSSGYFSVTVSLDREEESLTLVGLSMSSGALVSREIKVKAGFDGFPDIRNHWAKADISELWEDGLLRGYPDGLFHPERVVTRVELMAVLARMMNLKVPAGSSAEPVFTDENAIPPWAKGVVAAAQQSGLVAGYPDGSFRPNQPVCREELCVFLSRLIKGKEITWSPLTPIQSASVPSWARLAVSMVYGSGILRGKGTTDLNLTDTVNRAEMAAALNRCRILAK